MAADDGIGWIGRRRPHTADPLLGVQAGLVFAEDIAPQDLAVVFGAVPWETPGPVGAEAKAVYDRTHPLYRSPTNPAAPSTAGKGAGPSRPGTSTT